jgi:Protein of unknown function (DUF2783)
MLRLDQRFENSDAAYRCLIEAHRGLSLEQSQELNAKLVLLLANHIGEMEVLEEAVAVANMASSPVAFQTHAGASPMQTESCTFARG